MGTAPTLQMVADVHGAPFAAKWLAFQLSALVKTMRLAPDRAPSSENLLMVAESWVSAHPALKLSELWVFFQDWLGGRYGKKAFGGIDLTEMGADIDKHLAARRRQEMDALSAQRSDLLRKVDRWDELDGDAKERVLALVDRFNLEIAFYAPNFKRDLETYRQRKKSEI